jgi:myosin heavy subunit
MSRHALTGLGQVIKANTTEKTIDELRAEGKKRVRVVSSERVMAIIQAIVDDTISSEVGEITQRDRDRIVGETRERFSHVLKMQQDLEQVVEELRTSLSTTELERDRLKNDKSLLEAQLEAARKVDGETDDLERLSKDVARVRDTVERLVQSSGKQMDELAFVRLAEKLAAQEAQSSRRVTTEIDDLRERVGQLVRDVAASRDAAIETALQRSRDERASTDGAASARSDRDLRAVAEHLADIREKVGRAPAAEEGVARLRTSLDGFDKRLQGVERTSSELAARVAENVLARLLDREAAAAKTRTDTASAQAAAVSEAVHRVQQAFDESIRKVAAEVAQLRESAEEAQTMALSVQAEHFRDLERRLSTSVGESAGAFAKNTEQSAERLAALDGALQAVRREFTSLAAKTAEAAELQHEAVRALGEAVAKSSTAQSESMQAGFKEALDRALDKIEKTMQAATARPIEMTGEATDVLLSKIFDDPDSDLKSNYDQLDVTERRTAGSIANSVGRLKKMGGQPKPDAGQPA